MKIRVKLMERREAGKGRKGRRREEILVNLKERSGNKEMKILAIDKRGAERTIASQGFKLFKILLS